MDWQILKIFLPGFRIQSKVLMDFCILQLQWIADSSIFGPRFWTVCVIKVILPRFQIQTTFEQHIWLINHNRLVDLHTPIHHPHVCATAYGMVFKQLHLE